MSVEELEKKLLYNGWSYSYVQSLILWKRGVALFYLQKKNSKNPVLLFKDECYPCSDIVSLSFTTQWLLIKWKDGRRWFLEY